jgi:hypothetical protein
VLALAMHAALEFGAAPDVFGWAMAALLLVFWTRESPRIRTSDASEMQ